MPTHPPCGLYRTTRASEAVPESRLVFFHDHGDPGPGIYLPKSWNLNRVEWHERGTTVTDAAWTHTLERVPDEGLYRVESSFTCCDRSCTTFETSQLVQLGYDGEAVPILFVPEWSSRGLGFPSHGTRLDRDRLGKLTPLRVARGAESPRDAMAH